MLEFIGRFHPLLVHLPIGILLLACFFDLLAIRPAHAQLRSVVPLMLLIGFISALLSSISGFLLSGTADYDEDLVLYHQWLGIATTVMAGILFSLHKKGSSSTRWGTILLVLLITITGHFGGTLTHGEGYLTEGLGGEVETGPVLDSVPNIQQVAVYNGLVQPIFEARCVGCHGDSKQKGGLRLDGEEWILEGGEDGPILPDPKDGENSEGEMIKRLLLPLEAKKHMPPKAKSQLTPEEISLLHWWVRSGAPFNKKVGEMEQDGKMKTVLAALETGKSAGGPEASVSDLLPPEPVAPAPATAVERHRDAGVVVLPLAQNSNYLSVSFLSAQRTDDSIFQTLEELKPQLVWLKLDDMKLSPQAIKSLSTLVNLRKLSLSGSSISDADLSALQELKQLRSLNLSATAITVAGLQSIKALAHLRELYLYKTAIKSTDWPALQQGFPKVKIDTGNYRLPMLPGDTSEVKLN